MKRLQAFKYELQPNGEQARSMRRFAGSCRFVFNKALAMQKAIYEGGEKKLGYAGLCKRTHHLENSTGNRLAQRNTFASFAAITQRP
ncbi:MAG: helix-turn-helix domain-containing protein [Ferrovum myxofaciens]|nr:helix-turn-helix domain-containing protein [Ferrovum myxofaciens]MBU6994196.1 helix-turn-helix domain-containing protein [Ferrovum myxofaciens]